MTATIAFGTVMAALSWFCRKYYTSLVTHSCTTADSFGILQIARNETLDGYAQCAQCVGTWCCCCIAPYICGALRKPPRPAPYDEETGLLLGPGPVTAPLGPLVFPALSPGYR